MSSNQKLTFLVVTPPIVGRVNASMGSTSGLLKRGHRVVFLADESFKGRQESYGFEEYVYSLTEHRNQSNKDKTLKAGDRMANVLLEGGIIGPSEPIEKFRNLLNLFVRGPSGGAIFKEMDQIVKKAIEEIKPDCIWVDNTYLTPAISNSSIPWVYQISTTPTFSTYYETLEVPPGGSGK